MSKPQLIALTGPESTGKTRLAEQLAAYFDGVWVPEFARGYLTAMGRPYALADVVRIAHGQARAEDEALSSGAPYIFCDTDLLVCKIWAEKRFGKCPPEIEALYQARTYDLRLLCRPDLPWEPDPLREAPNLEERTELFTSYEAELLRGGHPFRMVGGLGEARLQNALVHLAEALG